MAQVLEHPRVARNVLERLPQEMFVPQFPLLLDEKLSGFSAEKGLGQRTLNFDNTRSC
jgi:hypothetical protein